MGQGDLLKILEGADDWLTSKQIAEKTGVGVSSTNVKLRKLRSLKLIEFKIEGREYLYKSK